MHFRENVTHFQVRLNSILTGRFWGSEKLGASLPLHISRYATYASNFKFGMKVAQIKEVKKSC